MKEDNKVDFDLSTLSLEELIKVYESVDEFIEFLNDSKIGIEENKEDDDE